MCGHGGWSCDQTILYKFWLIYHKGSSMKIEFNCVKCFCENNVLVY